MVHVPVDVMSGAIFVDKASYPTPAAFFSFYATAALEHSGRVYGPLLCPVSP